MNSHIEIKENIAYVSVDGNVTSANANEFEKTMNIDISELDGIVLDAAALEYISSAGLRVVLATKKRCKCKTFKVINVNNDVKNIFDVTGFSEIMDVSRAVGQISIDGCQKIGAGACGECYRMDDETIVKLYYPRINREEIEREKALAKKAFVMGVPTAISYEIVESNGRTGVMYELINSKTLCELIRSNPEKTEEYVDMYVDICRHIGSIHTSDPEIPSFKDINREDILKVTDLTEDEKNYLYRFIDLVPDGDACIHGDLNINNIMVQNGECCLIDMGEFSTGISVFDVSRIIFSMHYSNYGDEGFNSFYKLPNETVGKIFDMFMSKYLDGNSLEDAEKKDPELKWLYPLAWFRCCTSMLRSERWPEDKVKFAYKIFKEKLVPFVDGFNK